jgi:preprotein translocase subunit SecE
MKLNDENNIMAAKKEKPGSNKKELEVDAGQLTGSQISRAKEFAAGVKSEFNKIVWPSRKHTMGSTAVVVVFVILISFYLGAVDLVLGKIIGLFLH